MKNPLGLSWRTEIWSVLLLLVGALASIFFYAHFPERVATHWGFTGEPNGWSGRGFAAFFFPLLNLGLYLLLTWLPSLDPKAENYRHFSKIYQGFKNVLLLFMTAVYLVVGINGLGIYLPVGLIMPVAVGLLFVVLGYFMGRIKSNWFMGIRNPWTLSSEIVWQKTHHQGGIAFMIAGVLLALLPLCPEALRLPVFFLIIILAAVYPNVYSYFIYRSLPNKP